jgi:small subunit ribosomal protein S2
MALVDTNCDPDPIDHIIACNDDALKSIKLILQTLTNAVKDKKKELNMALVREEKEEAVAPKTKGGLPARRKPRMKKEGAQEDVQQEANA